jgi:thiol-disulfide isomerase/thioredoxin
MFVLVLIILPLVAFGQQRVSSDVPYSTLLPITARRERNLDHLDIETISYYLGIDPVTLEPLKKAPAQVGFDVAVMFYAQWCQNCHALAPYWDRIATHVRAGTKDSNLIMGLFNCELDTQHMQLCDTVGVQHYPTLLFIGTPPFRDHGFLSNILSTRSRAKNVAPLPNTVKFQGNWQYTESILDWIRAMQALSNWNKSSFLKSLRRGLLGFLKKPQPHDHSAALPVGLPVASDANDISSAQLSLLERRLKVIQEDSAKLEKLATHASLLLNSVIFPPSTKDAFSVLKEANGWDKANQDAVMKVLRNCVAELSLDYCSRVSTQVTMDYIAQMDSNATTPYNFTEIEVILINQIKEKEPFCAIFDECLEEDFVSEKCRPDKCPFNDQVACRYMTACFEESIQQEYAVALGIVKEGEPFPPKEQQATVTTPAADSGSGEKKGKSGGWGLFSKK